MIVVGADVVDAIEGETAALETTTEAVATMEITAEDAENVDLRNHKNQSICLIIIKIAKILKNFEKFSSANIGFSKRNLPLQTEIGVLTPVFTQEI
jgi:hypothetical protein